MKTKLSIGLIIVITVVVFYFLFFPARLSEQQSLQPKTIETLAERPAEEVVVAKSKSREESKEDDVRRAGMEAEYQKLEAARSDLRRQLSLLKTRLWNLELPAEQANRISEDLRAGYALLKNPPLLGAFHDQQGIEREIKKIEALRDKLADIEKFLDEVRGTEPEPSVDQ